MKLDLSGDLLPQRGGEERGQSIRLQLQRIAAGDESAFNRLYEATSDRLFAVAMNILRNRIWAEHALLESFLRIRQEAAAYAGRGDALAAMAVSVRNAAFDLAAQAGERVPPRRGEMIGARDSQTSAWGAASPNEVEAAVTMYSFGLTPEELGDHMGVSASLAGEWARRGARAFANNRTSAPSGAL